MESSFSSPSPSSSGRFKLLDRLELQQFQDKYVIKSVDYPNRGFSIGRRDGNIEPFTGKSLSYLIQFFASIGFLALVRASLMLQFLGLVEA